MATLTVQDMDASGLEPSYDAADAAGDEFEWEQHAFLHVKNGDGSPHTVTVAEQRTVDIPGYTQADLEVTVPAGEERMIGPFSRQAYQDSDGMVQVSYDAVTDVTLAAIALADV